MTESADPKAPGKFRVHSHVHTRRSVDSWLRPERIVAFARAADIDVVIVTDHDDPQGSLDCQILAADSGPLFPMAAEYKSTSGDVIAAFLTSAIVSRDPLGIIDETHAQGGLVILPHPFRQSHFADGVFEQVDLIEVFNSRCTDEENARALQTAQALGKPMIVGPDAHLARELGLALNELDASKHSDPITLLLSARREFIMRKTTKRWFRQSQMIRATREVRPVSFAKSLIRWVQAGPRQTP